MFDRLNVLLLLLQTQRDYCASHTYLQPSTACFTQCNVSELPVVSPSLSLLLQAQRDFFGSHTYQRTDKEGWFHTVWDENFGSADSITTSAYNR
jgi:6-phosphogluconate dehydrogenase